MNIFALFFLLLTTLLVSVRAGYPPRPAEVINDMNPYSAFSTTLPNLAESITGFVDSTWTKRRKNQSQKIKVKSPPAFTQVPPYRQVLDVQKTANSA